MNNLEKYNKVFMEVLLLKQEDLNENLIYQSRAEWDSVGHMELVSALEEEFDIMFDTEDIIDFNSYEKGKELLKKYDVKM